MLTLRYNEPVFILMLRGSRPNPAFFSVGTGVLSLSIEWLEHEVDHSPPYVTGLRISGTVFLLPYLP